MKTPVLACFLLSLSLRGWAAVYQVDNGTVTIPLERAPVIQVPALTLGTNAPQAWPGIRPFSNGVSTTNRTAAKSGGLYQLDNGTVVTPISTNGPINTIGRPVVTIATNYWEGWSPKATPARIQGRSAEAAAFAARTNLSPSLENWVKDARTNLGHMR